MEINPLTIKQRRHRRFLLALPLLTFPFITLLFWALGGGQVPKSYAKPPTKGLNSTLPLVYMDSEAPLSKMDYYERAQAEARQLEELIRNDPNYQEMAYDEWSEDRLIKDVGGDLGSFEADAFSAGFGVETDGASHEERLTQQLIQLENVLKDTLSPQPFGQQSIPLEPRALHSGMQAADVDRLEQMMDAMSQPEQEDPELQQLNGMLEKILDIQHPDRVQQQGELQQKQDKGKAFTIQAAAPSFLISSLARPGVQENDFFSLEQATPQQESQNAILAVVHDTQSLVSGSTVKLRLLTAIRVDGVLIPESQFIYGTATLTNERLKVQIKNIRYQRSVFPVQLSLYDLDGGSGIYIPNAHVREVINKSADQTFQSLGWNSLDPSLEAQALGAGVETTKRLFSKRARVVKVTVKAGYRVLLMNEK